MSQLKNEIARFRFNKSRITQETLAKSLGVSRQTINSIEKGKFNPSVILAIKMARFFECSVEELFNLKEK